MQFTLGDLDWKGAFTILWEAEESQRCCFTSSKQQLAFQSNGVVNSLQDISVNGVKIVVITF